MITDHYSRRGVGRTIAAVSVSVVFVYLCIEYRSAQYSTTNQAKATELGTASDLGHVT